MTSGIHARLFGGAARTQFLAFLFWSAAAWQNLERISQIKLWVGHNLVQDNTILVIAQARRALCRVCLPGHAASTYGGQLCPVEGLLCLLAGSSRNQFHGCCALMRWTIACHHAVQPSHADAWRRGPMSVRHAVLCIKASSHM